MGKVDYVDSYRKTPSLMKKICWLVPFSKHHSRRIKFIKSILGNVNSVIDIGSSEGKLLKMIKSKGVSNVLGVEPNLYYSQFCEKYYKIPVIKKYVEDIDVIEADLVTASEVIEHLDDPEVVIKKIKSKYLFLTLPVYNEIIDGHVHSFSPKEVLELLDKHYWRPIKIDMFQDKKSCAYRFYILSERILK